MRPLALAAAIALGLLASPVAGGFAPAAAQGKDDKKKDDEKKREEQRKKERERREKALRSIGGEFGAKDVESLLNRVPGEAKVALTMGGDDGVFSVAQARGVLTKYFDKFQTISVDFTKADDDVGSFTMKVRKKGEDVEKSRKLYVTIEGTNGRYTLVKLNVEGA